jgi:glycosyltransferase involved in cell wall biosynthesis
VSNVFFPGFINQKAVPSFFAMADIFVLLSHSEPWGLVINEAMSASLPIIASEEVGATADLVDSNNGFLISRANELEETIQALKILLKNPELRSAMGLQSLKKIQSWDFSATESGFLKAIDSL